MYEHSHPLAGLHILDLTRLLPGSVCTMLLADLGADVIKVEDPHGGDYARALFAAEEGANPFFTINNRNKRSLILNLKDARGLEVLKQLVRRADVLIESFRPGVMNRLGAGYDALGEVNPRLVYCSLSGWGQDGPFAQHVGHDLNYVSVTGLLAAMQTPQVIGGQLADVGGAYVAVAATLAALLRRERTGQGGYVDTAMAESVLPFVMYRWVEALVTDRQSGPGELTGALACFNVYTTQDGRQVALAALEEKFWVNFCTAVERPDWLAFHHRDPAVQSVLCKQVRDLFADQPAAVWYEKLKDADCCFTLVADPNELAEQPQFKARGMVGLTAEGTPWMRSPLRVSGSEPEIGLSAPGYGGHTRQVLSEAGYTADEIDRLLAQGVVVQG